MHIIKRKFTPPELAELWGVAKEKILAWIHSGELKAINAARSLKGQARYLIDAADIEAFERARAVVPPPVVERAPRQAEPGDFIPYFSGRR